MSGINVGIGGVARKVVKGYVGIGGVARKFYDANSGGGSEKQYIDITLDSQHISATPNVSATSCCEFSPNGMVLAIGGEISPFLNIYVRSGDYFIKRANTSISSLPPDEVMDLSFSPDGMYLAVAHNNSPYITIYKQSTGYPDYTYTKLNTPSSAQLPPDNANCCAFSSDGNYLAVGHWNTPYMAIYKRSGDTFTKLSNPSTLPAGDIESVAFSPDATYLATVTGDATPYLSIYKRSNDTFTRLSPPSALPDRGRSVSFSSDGIYLAVGHSTSPFLTIYKRSGDTFTKLSITNDLALSGTVYDIKFSPDDIYLAVATNASPFASIYKHNGDTFTLVQNLTSSTSLGTAFGISFGTGGLYLATARRYTPYISLHKLDPPGLE